MSRFATEKRTRSRKSIIWFPVLQRVHHSLLNTNSLVIIIDTETRNVTFSCKILKKHTLKILRSSHRKDFKVSLAIFNIKYERVNEETFNQ